MKKTMLILVGAIVIVSCKKTNDLPAPPTPTIPTLTKKGTDKLVTPPKTKVELIYTIKGGNTDDGDSRIEFSVDPSSTVSIATLNSFVVEYLRDADSSSILSTSFNPQSAGTLYLPMVKKDALYTLRITFNATAGASGTFILRTKLSSGLTDNTGWVKSTVITFGTDVVSFASDPDSPDTTQLVLGGTEVRMQTFKIFVQGNPTLTGFVIPVTNIGSVQTVSIWDSAGTTMLGSTSTFSAGVATISTNTAQPNVWARYVVRVQLKPVTSAAMSNIAVQTSVSSVSFKTTDGLPKVATGSATGNSMQIFKSALSVSSPGASGLLQNGIQNNLNVATVSSAGGSSAVKTLSWDVGLLDNFPDTNVLKIKNLGIKVNNSVLAPGTFSFTNQNGVVIDSLTELDTRLYVTFTGEILIPAGSSTTITLLGTPMGYVSGGDAWKSRVLVNDSPTNLRYLNAGSPVGVLAKLADIQAPTASAVVYAMLVSDNASGGSHSATLGASTPDWTNSRWVGGETAWYVLTR